MTKMTISGAKDELKALELRASALLNAMDELDCLPHVFDAYQLLDVLYTESDARIIAINEALEKAEVDV